MTWVIKRPPKSMPGPWRKPGWNRQRREKHHQKKSLLPPRCLNRCERRRRDARGALNVTRNRRRAGQRTENRANCHRRATLFLHAEFYRPQDHPARRRQPACRHYRTNPTKKKNKDDFDQAEVQHWQRRNPASEKCLKGAARPRTPLASARGHERSRTRWRRFPGRSRHSRRTIQRIRTMPTQAALHFAVAEIAQADKHNHGHDQFALRNPTKAIATFRSHRRWHAQLSGMPFLESSRRR